MKEEEKKKKKKKERTQPMEIVEKKKKRVKSCGWPWQWVPSYVFNYKNAIENKIMETENS